MIRSGEHAIWDAHMERVRVEAVPITAGTLVGALFALADEMSSTLMSAMKMVNPLSFEESA